MGADSGVKQGAGVGFRLRGHGGGGVLSFQRVQERTSKDVGLCTIMQTGRTVSA